LQLLLPCGPGCQCINCENLLPKVTQTPASEVSEAATLYFQGDIEQSLLIGEEVEIREDSEGSDINTESSSESESDETDDHI